jgi:hypothetical protein
MKERRVGQLLLSFMRMADNVSFSISTAACRVQGLAFLRAYSVGVLYEAASPRVA